MAPPGGLIRLFPVRFAQRASAKKEPAEEGLRPVPLVTGSETWLSNVPWCRSSCRKSTRRRGRQPVGCSLNEPPLYTTRHRVTSFPTKAIPRFPPALTGGVRGPLVPPSHVSSALNFIVFRQQSGGQYQGLILPGNRRPRPEPLRESTRRGVTKVRARAQRLCPHAGSPETNEIATISPAKLRPRGR